jgi:hypothetical protein
MSQRLSEAFVGLLKAFTYAVYCHSPNAKMGSSDSSDLSDS